MPNWVHNSLTVMGKPQDIAAFIHKAGQAVPNKEPNPLQFHNFVPVPNEFSNSMEGLTDWEFKNWGCKWDAINCEIHPGEDDSEAFYYFDTAWDPPVKILKTIGQAHPDLLFLLQSHSMESGYLLDVIVLGDIGYLIDRSGIMDAGRNCTCGCFNEITTNNKRITVVPQVFWLRGKKELACRV